MNYLADTVAIVRHLQGPRGLGRRAAHTLGEADDGLHHIYLSAITLMEVLYLSEAKRIDLNLGNLISHISGSANYEIVPVDANIVLAAVSVDDVPELHDRIIVATAKHLGAMILTSDAVIERSRHVETIW